MRFDFGLLRVIRRRKGLSQKSVSHALNITQSLLSKWENGFTPISCDNLARIATLYGLSDISEFFFENIRT